MLSSSRWDSPSGPPTITDALPLRTYNLVIGAILLYGFAINAFMVKFCAHYFENINYLVLLIGYFVLCFLGIRISLRSDSPGISFLGYNMVVVPVGVILSLGLEAVESAQIIHAAALTAIVTLSMMAMAAVWPEFFLSLGRVLFFALLIVIIAEICTALMGIYMPRAWDIGVAIIFCGYIGFDWAKAQQTDHTLDNAVDACVGLYLDIINLFLRILSSSSKSSSRRK